MIEKENNDIELIIGKLDFLADKVEDLKTSSNDRFDKIDGKIEKIMLSQNEQEKISLRHEIKIKNLGRKVICVDKKINEHIDNHALNEIKDVEEKTVNKERVRVVWAIAVFIIVQIALIIFGSLQGFIKIG